MAAKLPPQSGSHLPNSNPPIDFRNGTTDDRFLFEEHAYDIASFGPGKAFKWTSIPEYGILHPTRPGYRLIKITLADTEGKHRWMWFKEGSHYDSNPFQTTYSSESNDHPIFQRDYVVLRSDYFDADGTPKPKAKAGPLDSVFGLTVLSGGSSQLRDGVHDLAFVGGDGSGVAGNFQTVKGVVTAVWLTATGTGYTTAPTVTAGGVSGASIIALVQPQTAVLVKEDAPPAPGELGNVFLNVTRIYETLPGPELLGYYLDFRRGGLRVDVFKQVILGDGVTPDEGAGVTSSSITPIDSVKSERMVEISGSAGTLTGLGDLIRVEGWTSKQDPRTNTIIYRISAFVAPGTAIPALTSHPQIDLDSDITGLYVVAIEPQKTSEFETEWVITACLIPASYLDFTSPGIRFPGIFAFLEQFFVSFSFPYTPPFPGVHFTYLPPRTNTHVARVTHFFTLGLPDTQPDRFSVLSPGTMSKMVPIREDTIHPAFDWTVTVDSETTLVERIPASDPPTYDPNEIYIWDVECTRWMGDIWETKITEASEGKSLSYFPPVQQGTGLRIGPYAGGFTTNIDYGALTFYAVNTNAGANAVSLFGYRGPTWTKVSGSTPADAGLLNLGSAVLNTLEFVSGDGVSQSDGVELYTSGTAGTALVSITSQPANNDQIKLGFLHGSATYNTTWTFKTVLTENVPSTGTLTISGVVIDAETATIGSEIYEFDSHAVPRFTVGNKGVDISPYATAAQGTITVAPESAGNTFTLGSKTFTCVLLGSLLLDGQFEEGSSAADQAAKVFSAINGLDGVNTAHPDVTCGGFPGLSALITAKAGGAAGNSIASTGASAITFDAVTLGTTTAGTNCSAANAVTALVARIMDSSFPSALVTAVDGVGNTVVVTSKTGGTAANYATTETMANGAWGGATLTGGSAAVANQILIGGSATAASVNLQKGINGTGTAGTHYSTGTVANTIVTVPTETAVSSFTLSTVLPADWEVFGSWQTGGNFDWLYSANGAIVTGAYGSVANIAGAANGSLVGTLTTANHSLICNVQSFDDPQLKSPNFPTTPDTLTTGALLVGNRTAQIWFGGFGGMPLNYEKSIDGSTNWIAGSTSLAAFSTNTGGIHKVGITDFAAASLYRYIRFNIGTALNAASQHNYGLGRVSRLFLQMVWTV